MRGGGGWRRGDEARVHVCSLLKSVPVRSCYRWEIGIILREQKCQLHNRKGFECSPEQNSLTAELSNAKGNAARRLHQLWAEARPELLQPLPQGSQGSSGICISCLAKQVTQHTHLEFWSANQEGSQNYLMELNLWWTAAVTRKDVHMQDFSSFIHWLTCYTTELSLDSTSEMFISHISIKQNNEFNFCMLSPGIVSLAKNRPGFMQVNSFFSEMCLQTGQHWSDLWERFVINW